MTIERISQGKGYLLDIPELVTLPNGEVPGMYININDENGKPFELFIQYKPPEFFELIAVITRMVSMALREGVPAKVIAKELMDIHSPVTRHFKKGEDSEVPSLTYRVGEALEQHIMNS